MLSDITVALPSFDAGSDAGSDGDDDDEPPKRFCVVVSEPPSAALDLKRTGIRPPKPRNAHVPTSEFEEAPSIPVNDRRLFIYNLC